VLLGAWGMTGSSLSVAQRASVEKAAPEGPGSMVAILTMLRIGSIYMA
jgi:hypothetical protein